MTRLVVRETHLVGRSARRLRVPRPRQNSSGDTVHLKAKNIWGGVQVLEIEPNGFEDIANVNARTRVLAGLSQCLSR